MEVCYGTMTACETAYYTYIYAKVDKKHYQKVTSHMRGASLTGRFMSGLSSQILIHFGMTIMDLNYLTLGGRFDTIFLNFNYVFRVMRVCSSRMWMAGLGPEVVTTFDKKYRKGMKNKKAIASSGFI